MKEPVIPNRTQRMIWDSDSSKPSLELESSIPNSPLFIRNVYYINWLLIVWTENGVCHGKSWFNWIQPLIVNAMHWCYKFSFCCSRWYQVWECADYVLQLALPCWLCIFQTHLHSIWWPLRFLFFLWHWWTKTLLSCTWGLFSFLLICLFYLFCGISYFKCY